MGAFGTYFVACVGGGLEFQNPKPSRMFSNVGGCYRDSHCFGETQQPGFFMVFQGLLLTSYLGLLGFRFGVAEFSTSQQQQSPLKIWYDMMRFNREGGGALPFSENTRLLFDTANVGTHNGAMGGERWAEGDLVMIVIHGNHP